MLVDVEMELVLIVDTEKVVAVLDGVLIETVEDDMIVLDCTGVDEVFIVLVSTAVEDDDESERRRAPHTPELYDGAETVPL